MEEGDRELTCPVCASVVLSPNAHAHLHTCGGQLRLTRPSKSQLHVARWASVPSAANARKVSMLCPMETATTDDALSRGSALAGAASVCDGVWCDGSVLKLGDVGTTGTSPRAPR